MQRLKGGEWFTMRVSVCGLFSTTYPLVADSPVQQELCTLFRDLCRDETPMVRRAAAHAIGDFAAAMECRTVQQVLLPMLTHLLKDDQESVRKLSLESAPKFLRALASSDALLEVVDLCTAVMADRSWRVRHAAAARMPDMAEALGQELTASHLVKAFVSLLQVRCEEKRVQQDTVVHTVTRSGYN
jgi:serine/threonine-protein phosphatase 2A regulatory subunit A